MEPTIANSTLPVARPLWDNARLSSRIVHLGCGAFHRAHQALYTHHLLEQSDSDWGICEVNLMPGNDQTLIENLKKQNLLYTVAEKGAQSTELKIIGSMKEALHPAIDGCAGILTAMAREQTAIVSLTVTEKGYCTEAASGKLDLNNPLIQHDLAHPSEPKSAIGYIVEALRLRREHGLNAFTVMSCDNVRENGHVARGVCVEKDGVLDTIVERTHIEKREDGPAYTEDDGATWHALDEDTTVSMNLWGFTPDFVDALKKDFVSFLENDVPKNPLKAEYFLPFVVNDQIRDGKADVTVLKSADKWFGVTYKADKPVVMAALAEMMQNGTYPDPLWK